MNRKGYAVSLDFWVSRSKVGECYSLGLSLEPSTEAVIGWVLNSIL